MLQPRLVAPWVLDRVFYTPSFLSSARHVLRPHHSLPRRQQTPTSLSSSFSTISSSKTSRILGQLFTRPQPQIIQIRHASHATQGSANRHSRDPAGKRLGAKRANGEYVVTGCIIFRQRGTKWFPGENCEMGRDHTIYAKNAGYVRYYLDPERHPDRKYIGVCFEKYGTLPTPRNAPTKRKLNRVAVPMVQGQVRQQGGSVGLSAAAQSDLLATVTATESSVGSVEALDAAVGPQLRPGYMYREANWQIGRVAEKAGVTAKPYKRKNRWLAWRKRQARKERAAQMQSLKSRKKAAKKANASR